MPGAIPEGKTPAWFEVSLDGVRAEGYSAQELESVLPHAVPIIRSLPRRTARRESVCGSVQAAKESLLSRIGTMLELGQAVGQHWRVLIPLLIFLMGMFLSGLRDPLGTIQGLNRQLFGTVQVQTMPGE